MAFRGCKTNFGSLVAMLACLAFLALAKASHGSPLRLFTSDGRDRLYSLDAKNGKGTLIGDVGEFTPGLDFRGNGVLYASSSSLQTIDTRTGLSTVIASLPALMSSIAFSPNDELFSINVPSNTLFKLNPVTGVTISSVPISGTMFASGGPFPNELTGIDFAPDGTLYGIGFALYTIDVSTGHATRITPLGFDATDDSELFHELDYGPDGVLRAVSGVSSPANLYTINQITGRGTSVVSTGLSQTWGIASQIPEPSTLALAAFGFMGLAAWGWRRRKSP